MDTCTVAGCQKTQKKNDSKYCSMHRARLTRTNRLTLLPTGERIELKSIPIPESGCWIWTEYCNNHGYGRFRVDGKKTLAHRASYEAFIGPIPEGMLVCHKCDTPACVNPSHLFLGTDKDNVRDCINKGRHKGILNSPFIKGHNIHERRK